MTHESVSRPGEIHPALIIPCLNEEETLADTCASLGFGVGKNSHPTGALLFLIDNGSTDSTIKVAEQIKSDSEENTVFIGHEPERGFVPPRHRGNLMVEELARSMNWRLEDVLILQADADTHYTPGYVASMRAVAESCGPNMMVEACVTYPPAFRAEYLEYMEICNAVDGEFERLFARDLSDDDLVDDKVSGYRLNDYFNWGGLRREYTAGGEEIHAETARLYMRARAQGARRERVDDALAFHSARKVLENPSLHLATAGFPREVSWNARWRQSYSGPRDLRGLCEHHNHADVLKAIRVREEHLLALLGVLPVHVDRALAESSSVETVEFANIVLPLLPERTRDDLLSRPGIFLTDVFELLDRHGDALLEEANKLTPHNGI
jgi:glycosyltransferase involved in cell wall biosynthesis